MEIQDVLTLLSIISVGLGLLMTGIGIARTWIASLKERKNKTKEENLDYLKTVADKAMAAAEATSASGADKKAVVIAAVDAAAKEANITDVADYLTKVSKYIEDSVTFAKSFSNNKKKESK